MTNLHTLNLSSTSLNGRFTAATLLPHLHSLRHLNLNYCNMREKGAGLLASALSSCSHLHALESLQINSNGLNGGKGSKEIFDALPSLTSLHTLSMNRMELKEKQVNHVLLKVHMYACMYLYMIACMYLYAVHLESLARMPPPDPEGATLKRPGPDQSLTFYCQYEMCCTFVPHTKVQHTYRALPKSAPGTDWSHTRAGLGYRGRPCP